MKTILETWEWKPVVKALMACKGFQEVAAMTIIGELGDLRRFEHPRQLMAFLGLVPGEDSSGPKRRQGSITKCGNSHTRWMLVECAQHYRKAPKVSRPLSIRQEGQPREIKELSWRMQNRLHKRYVRLKARGKPTLLKSTRNGDRQGLCPSTPTSSSPSSPVLTQPNHKSLRNITITQPRP